MNQLICLTEFAITGIVIGIWFDIFRILRKSFKTADWVTYIQDIVFWLIAGFIILCSIFTFNNGEIRIYVFVGIILGLLVYMLTISKYLIKFSVIIIKFINKVLLYPIKVICNFLILPIKNIIHKFLTLLKKIQHNHTKNKIKTHEKRRNFLKNVEK